MNLCEQLCSLAAHMRTAGAILILRRSETLVSLPESLFPGPAALWISVTVLHCTDHCTVQAHITDVAQLASSHVGRLAG